MQPSFSCCRYELAVPSQVGLTGPLFVHLESCSAVVGSGTAPTLTVCTSTCPYAPDPFYSGNTGSAGQTVAPIVSGVAKVSSSVSGGQHEYDIGTVLVNCTVVPCGL